MSSSVPIGLKREGSSLWVRINRPEANNAFNSDAIDQFGDAIREAELDPSIRVIVITGVGRAFSSGADINRLLTSTRSETGQGLRRRWLPLLQGIRQMPKAVIAGINGVAAGIGASIAMACDVRIASQDAYFTEAFTKIGAGPDGGASWMLPRLIGRGRALELFTADRLSAAEAERWGLVNRVVPSADLESECRQLADRIARMPVAAIAASKREVNFAEVSSFADSVEFESRLQEDLLGTPDHREGLSAFLEKREPKFNQGP